MIVVFAVVVEVVPSAATPECVRVVRQIARARPCRKVRAGRRRGVPLARCVIKDKTKESVHVSTSIEPC